ncbi:MAG: hypothetical protein PVI37_11740 [Gammaproteobacteria bacterium]|jgi:cytochrome bd-type quinol oxidase subunit 2
MNPKAVTAIAFKVSGIYVLVSAVLALPGLVGAFHFERNQNGSPVVDDAWLGIVTAATIVVAILVFRLLWRLGSSTLAAASELDAGHPTQSGSLEKALFVTLGLYFTVSAIVEFPNIAARLWVRGHAPAGPLLSDYALLASTAIELFIGLMLIAKVESWLSLIRDLGQRQPD